MTENKPIIIDGVDVSGCEYYQYDMCTATKDNYGDCSYYCTDYDMKDCYFKQLAHKTRECEKWKLQATSLSYADTICALEIDLEHKTQECEELKKYLKRIEEYCKEQNLKADYTACEVLQIIDEVENDR